jgi:hypothetical protein
MITLAALDALADALLAHDEIRSVSLDPAEVNAPGVWISTPSIDVEFLNGGATLTPVLYLIVPDNGVTRSMRAAVELLNHVVEAVGLPSAAVTPARVALPSSASPLPALAFPIDLPGDPS